MTVWVEEQEHVERCYAEARALYHDHTQNVEFFGDMMGRAVLRSCLEWQKLAAIKSAEIRFRMGIE